MVTPAVARSAVIGHVVEGDEEVVAFVQPSTDIDLSSGDLEAFTAQYLAPYKRPSHFVIVPAMPMTATGKIAKNELKKVAETGDFSCKIVPSIGSERKSSDPTVGGPSEAVIRAREV